MKACKQDNSFSRIPKISDPFTNSHTKFPRPHELTGNDKLEGRELI